MIRIDPLCFRYDGGDAFDVEIVDYHSRAQTLLS